MQSVCHASADVRVPPASLVAAAAALLCTACGAAASRAPVASPSLPAYEGRATELFDDGIGAHAIGRGVEPTESPRERDLLRERTHLGDCVARARVVTLTSAQDETGPRWVLGLHTLERLTGRCAGDDFTVRIDARSPGAGIVRALDGQIIGARLVAFLREFASAEGSREGELHFHLAGDGKDEVDAVRIAALAGEISQ